MYTGRIEKTRGNGFFLNEKRESEPGQPKGSPKTGPPRPLGAGRFYMPYQVQTIMGVMAGFDRMSSLNPK